MIRLENVFKYYHNKTNTTCALSKINLSFKEGEFVAITGESGSGKSTLANIIAGNDSYEDGQIYIDDKPTSFYDEKDWEKYRKDYVSFIYQDYRLIESFNVLENVFIPLLIKGYSLKESKKIAKEYLKKVGLSNCLKQKCSKLSGGQKQRVAIARALAKNSKIIIADEPTGNLDEKNGLEIMKLLKEISPNHIVIVITHNYKQALPFISRNVRLHDGVVVSDEQINALNEDESIVDNISSKGQDNSFILSTLNIKSQPKKSVLLMLLSIICILSSFIFLGSFSMSYDESQTKNIDNSLFVNLEKDRLLIANTSQLSNEEAISFVDNIKHVKEVDKYDAISDINCYLEDDYFINYSGGWTNEVDGVILPEPVYVDSSSIALKNHNRFIHSYYGINESDLKHGTLPTNDFEMVIYSNDTSLLNTTQKVLFRNAKYFPEETYVEYEVKITGLLKNKTSNVYFSTNIAEMMQLARKVVNYQITYSYEKYYELRVGRIANSFLIIDDSLSDNKIRLPKKILKNLLAEQKKGAEFKNVVEDKYLASSFYFSNKRFDVLLDLNDYYESGTSNDYIAVSKVFFENIYQESEATNQFCAFVDDYANVNEVIKKISENGLNVISCYKASLTSYNVDKVIQRYLTLTISVLATLFICFLNIIITYSILKMNKGDYIILKALGLENKTIRKVNFFEILLYELISFIISAFISLLVYNLTNNQLLLEFFKYIKFYNYLLLLLLCFICSAIITKKYTDYLKKQVRLITIEDE